MDDKGKNMKRPQMIDMITLEIIKQFPRPCHNCNCYLEEKFVTPKEAVGKATCKNIHTKDADTNYQGVHIIALQRRTRPIQGDRK